MITVYDNAQWVRPLGVCKCGKQATGELMSNRNDVLTKVCTRCGTASLKAAEKARAKKVTLA